MQRICEHCGKSFQITPYQVERGRGHYCSRACYFPLNPIRIEGDIAYVTLTDGKKNPKAVVKIDAVDVPRLQEFGKRWAPAWWERHGQYKAVARIALESGSGGKGKMVTMHRWLMDAPDGVEVDHINGNTLDNRRSENLRLVTHSENNQNRRGARRGSKSGVRGVSWNEAKQKWNARVTVNGKVYRLGANFTNLAEAERVVVEARRRLMTHSQD